MNILVTGGSGFIGTRLVEALLKEHHSIKIFDKVLSTKYPELTIISDVRDKQALIDECKGIDLIYNLAAEHADNVMPTSLYQDVNIGGANNVVDAAKANGIKKIIFTSSVAIYGLNKDTPDESVEAQPFNEYGRTKNEAETIFLEWVSQNDEYSLTILRSAVVFGENNRGNVYNLINQIVKRKFIMIGDGDNKKSMGYVGNIASFLAFQVNINQGSYIYNFADKPDLSSKEIVDIVTNELGFKNKIPSVPYEFGILGGFIFDIISKISGKKLAVSSVRIKKFTADTSINTDKLIASGFSPPYSLEKGLRNMIIHEFK